MLTRVVMTCLVLHNLLRISYPAGQQPDFTGDSQPPIAPEGSDLPYDATQWRQLKDREIFSGTIS